MNISLAFDQFIVNINANVVQKKSRMSKQVFSMRKEI